MYCVVETAAVLGVEAVPIQVQVHVSAGLPSFHIVGLGDTAVKESRERITTALRMCGFKIPTGRITVNLAPAPLRKSGTGFDLPIALGILGATNQCDNAVFNRTIVVGELSLDGAVNPVRSMVSYALYARDNGLRLMCGKTSVVDGLVPVMCATVQHLKEALTPHYQVECEPVAAQDLEQGFGDYADVAGQDSTIRAMTIAAAGNHNILLIGPPGSGKTMLASRIVTILPPLSLDERIQTATIHSTLDPCYPSTCARPFRQPHHTASLTGLIGGGTPVLPGEVSLAHNGVLFLDEMVQFAPSALQALRGPIEDKIVNIVRSDSTISLPADFMLIGAANPCACGFYGDPTIGCTCSEFAVSRYQNRVGGPLLDRFDLIVKVRRPSPDALFKRRETTKSHLLRKQVHAARILRDDRSVTAQTAGTRTALVDFNKEARVALRRAAARFALSARAIMRVSRVARTISFLEPADSVAEDHVLEALSFRGGW